MKYKEKLLPFFKILLAKLFKTYQLPLLILGFLITSLLGVYAQENNSSLFLLTSDASTKKTDTLRFSNYNEILSHITEVSNLEQENGFLAAVFSSPIKTNDSTFATNFTKNNKTNFVSIRNWKLLSKKIQKKAAPVSTNKTPVFKIEAIKSLMKSLNQGYSENGDPFNSIRLDNLKQQRDTLYADIIIKTTKKRTIDSLVINGYKKFPVSFLKYYSGIKKGTVFNRTKIKSQTELLNSLPFASNERSAEILFNPVQTVLYLYLQKKNANNFDGFLGFSTDEESGDLTLDGYLNLNLINNLNFGEEIALTYKSDSEEQQLFQLNLKLPYLFKLPLSLEASLEIFRQEDEFSSTEQKIGFSYAFSQKLETLLGYKNIESADLNENENLVSINQNFDATFINSETRFLVRQDSKLFPYKTRVIFSSELGNRKQGDVTQFKLGLNFQQIFQLNTRNSIYIANNAQFFQSNNYLANELYRLGGILSIRGFEENSLRASLYNVLNTEYRFQLNNTIYVHSIIDFGYLDNQAPRTTGSDETVGSENLSSFGVGFGMITKAGLFKLNYANGRSSSIPFEFNNSKIHISLTAFF